MIITRWMLHLLDEQTEPMQHVKMRPRTVMPLLRAMPPNFWVMALGTTLTVCSDCIAFVTTSLIFFDCIAFQLQGASTVSDSAKSKAKTRKFLRDSGMRTKIHLA